MVYEIVLSFKHITWESYPNSEAWDHPIQPAANQTRLWYWLAPFGIYVLRTTRSIVAWVYHLVCPSGLSTFVPMTSGIRLGSNIAPVKGVEQFEVTTWLKKYGHLVKLNN